MVGMTDVRIHRGFGNVESIGFSNRGLGSSKSIAEYWDQGEGLGLGFVISPFQGVKWAGGNAGCPFYFLLS